MKQTNKQQSRSTRFTYSFTLNTSKEQDIIDIIDNVEGMSIAEFTKIAIYFLDREINSLIEFEGIEGCEDDKKERFDLLISLLQEYKESHK